MNEWNGKLTRIQAIKIIESFTDQDDPFWENIVEEYYDEDSDTLPSIYHVFAAMGVTEQEYKDATGAENVNWPQLTHNAELSGPQELNMTTETAPLQAVHVDAVVSQHFNQLTPAEAERLALLAEECGEVIQAIGKILRHGYESRHPDGGPTNREALERECGDVYHCIWRIIAAGDIDGNGMSQRADDKAKSVAQYLHHAG